MLNKDLHICTLDSKANVNITLTVEEGKGYVPAIKHNIIVVMHLWNNHIDSFFLQLEECLLELKIQELVRSLIMTN